jgi:hypothetical protein
MTHATTNRDMQARRHDRAAAIPASRGQTRSIMTCWRWLVAISRVVVERRYAAPWERQANRTGGMNAAGKPHRQRMTGITKH